MYSITKSLLFLLSPERAHYFVARMLKIASRIPGLPFLIRKSYEVKHPSLERKVFGLTFPNPVGLAAGFDKNAAMFHELNWFGFGAIEVGTVTPLAQPGNPQPRLFRLPTDQALINRMGFNNEGVEAMVERLKHRPKGLIIGGNIGKNKNTPNEEADSDYVKSFEALFPYVDYFVVNVSSPNTPGLRALQEKEPLLKLLNGLELLNGQKAARKPILLKIAPDLTDEQLNDIVEIVQESGIAGVIATNTTISRDDLKTDKKVVEEIGMGGLSGKPVTQRSTEVVRYLSEKSKGSFPIIAAGGIHSAQDALDKIAAGATLVQVYTGFIYEGPALVKRINKALIQR